MIEKMYYVQIIGLREAYFNILRCIRNLKLLHVKVDPNSPFPVEFEDPLLKEDQEQLQDRETKLASLMSYLNGEIGSEETPGEGVPHYDSWSINGLIEKCDEILFHLNPELAEIERTQQILKSHQEQLLNFEKTFTKARELVERIKEAGSTGSTEVLLVILDRRSDASLPKFEQRVAEVTEDQFELQFRSFDENHIAVIVMFPQEYRSDMESFLFGYRISQLWLPEDLRGLPFRELPERTKNIQEQYQTQISAAEHRKNALRVQYLKEVKELRQEIQFRIVGINLLMHSVFTNIIFRIEGFIPTKLMNEFETKLKAEFGTTITILKKKATKNAPILRTNPAPIDVFEILTRLGAIPKYKTLDPTPFTFVLFPLFWGLMVGDIAYGAIIFFVANYIRKKVKSESIKEICKIFMISSVWAIFFGVLFGEFFGDLGVRANLIHPIWFDRLKDIILYIEITIFLGLIIVLFGMLLGVYNSFQLGNRRAALGLGSSFVVWFTLGLGLGTLIFRGTTRLLWLSMPIVIVAAGIILWVQGPMGILELYGRFSNILSYTRLMAIGMISVMMTFVANTLAATVNPWGGIPLAIMLHLINMIIAVMSPSVHALRLNLYEFFTQFEHPGGIRYQPFGIK